MGTWPQEKGRGVESQGGWKGSGPERWAPLLLRACGSFSKGLPGGKGAVRGGGVLTCSNVDQPSPKGSCTEVPGGTQSWRQEAQEVAEGGAGSSVPVPSHSAQAPPAAELCSDGRVSISVSYKDPDASQAVLIF